MADEKKTSGLDILGIKPIGEAISTTVEKSFQGIEGFLKSVCVPALDEIGLLLRDKIRYWRLTNILNILTKAKGKLDFENEQLQIHAHPRVALAIIENGSLNDCDEVQEMWAGLFASSCSKTGQEDENLIFVDLLKQLTNAEAKILRYSCDKARKIKYKNGLIIGDSLKLDCKILIEITGISEIHRLDRELDHLRSIGLIGNHPGGGGFSALDDSLIVDMTPTALALNLYVRSQGHNADPSFYWQNNIITYDDLENEIKLKRQKKSD